jgi:hypothetical protein
MTVYTHCPDCHHPPLRHVPDGLGATCIVCAWEMQEAFKRLANGDDAKMPQRICTRRFTFRIQGKEREQAMMADKNSWAAHDVCIECGCEWMQHFGWLCPTGDTLFVKLIDTDPGKDIVGDS